MKSYENDNVYCHKYVLLVYVRLIEKTYAFLAKYALLLQYFMDIICLGMTHMHTYNAHECHSFRQ